jgi:hypothetical protein
MVQAPGCMMCSARITYERKNRSILMPGHTERYRRHGNLDLLGPRAHSFGNAGVLTKLPCLGYLSV